MVVAAAASSSSSFVEKHDVFLSFRGEDTRDGFASYLYEALCRNQIQTYMDDHQLQRGDEISTTLVRAIQESKISVIIFSKNYASSTWCLDELLHILESKKIKGQIVIPIFYRINVSIVRKQMKSYAIAFEELEQRFKDRIDKVNQWRDALKYAAGLSGLDSKLFRPEYELVRKIVQDISLHLRKYQSSNEYHYKGLIGIEKRVKKIESLLCIGSIGVRIIGIWGMGGIGKTTLSSVISQRLISCPHFEGRCFLWNFRDECARYGPNQLRKKLLAELFDDEAILSMDTPFVLSPFVRDRFRRKKVLIVLDDVDSSHQLEIVVKGYDQLASGSRIIVTTRDVRVLRKVTDQIYEVEELNRFESLELFRLHAFSKNSLATTNYEELSKRVAYYANGNPLALTILGSFLHSRSKPEWESALNKLEIVPNPSIQNVLRISYEGLDDTEKDIFLDIACFFMTNGIYNRDEVESILDARACSAKIGLSVLIERSLVTDYSNEVSMHNLLLQMGWTIVCNEHQQPEHRTRLWISKDSCCVLERDIGTHTIRSLTLRMADIKKDVKVNPAAFSKMNNLRYLSIINPIGDKSRLKFCQGHEFYISNNLRYLHWDFYPFKSLPPNFTPENLVELILQDSQLEVLWNEVQPLEKLKLIHLGGSKLLTQIPNLSRALNIESIYLKGCASLVQVPSYFKNLHKLKFLDLSDCSDLIDVEGISVRIDCLDDHENCGYINKNLRYLLLCGTAMESVPSSFGRLSGLVQLDLHDCKRLKILPTSISKLKSLESLDLSGCINLEKFPEILEPMECLHKIKLTGAGIKEIPESIENLIGLLELDLCWCKNIELLPNSMSSLRHLETWDLVGCSKLQKLPPLSLGLLKLDVRFCDNLKSISELPPFLKCLDTSYCTSLETISCWMSTPLMHQRCGSSYRFGNCHKLDQKTSNNILPHGASLEILSCARLSRKSESKYQVPSLVFCYPGDEIPKCFSYQTDSRTSIDIKLGPYWCNTNFLGFAFCAVLDLSNIAPKIQNVQIECHCSFKTTDDHDYVDDFSCKKTVSSYFDIGAAKLNSDHVFMFYDHTLCIKMLQEKFGSNWSSICSTNTGTVTEASFIIQSNSESDHGCKIKKCGVWLVHEEDGEQLMDVDQESAEEEEEEETSSAMWLRYALLNFLRSVVLELLRFLLFNSKGIIVFYVFCFLGYISLLPCNNKKL